MIVNPSKGGLLTNFINAHPPSYHRIIASLDENDISTTYEALMPVIFLRKKKADEYFIKTEKTRQIYMDMATSKVKEHFKIDNIENLAKQLKLKEKLSYKIGKTYAFLDLKTNERIFGKLEDITYVDNISEPFRYKIKIILGGKPDEIKVINPFTIKEVPLNLGEHYKFTKEGILRLKNIELDEIYFKNSKNKKKSSQYLKKYTGIAIFEKIFNKEGVTTVEKVEKPIFKKRLPKSYEELESIKGEHVFLKKQGTFQLYKLNEVNFKENYMNYKLKLVMSDEFRIEEDKDIENIDLEFSKDEVVIKYGDFYFNFHNDDFTHRFEDNFIKYYAKHKLRVVFVLKKAVNAEIDGIIESFEYDEGKISQISIKNYFNEEFVIEKIKIDGVFIQKPTLVIQKAKDVSVFTNLMNKIGNKIHPERFFK